MCVLQVISFWGHESVHYHPYGDSFSLWGQNPSPHKQKMIEITCLVYPVKPTSLGAGLHAFWRFWPRLMVQDHMDWTIRTLWSWTIHNLKELSKSNMLQDNI